jgi:hypothetical protein
VTPHKRAKEALRSPRESEHTPIQFKISSLLGRRDSDTEAEIRGNIRSTQELLLAGILHRKIVPSTGGKILIEGRPPGGWSFRKARYALACLAFSTLVALPFCGASEEPVQPPRPSHNLFGMTGLIDMPTAEMQPDAQLSLTTGFFGGYLRNTLSAQILPGVEAAFRYSILEDLVGGTDGGTLYDRSFDIKLRLIEESKDWPAFVFGLQDFLGTGVYSGEYFAATKDLIGGDLKLTGGLGWGRFAGTNGIGNPLCFNMNRFCTRDAPDDTGGTVNFGQFLSGEELGFFGGIEWKTPIRNISLKAEYSDDAYQREEALGPFAQRIPFNFGLEYRPTAGIEVGAYYMYGSEVGLKVSISGNPFHPLAKTDGEPAARPVLPRPIPYADPGASPFGRIKDFMDGEPVSTRFEDAGFEDVKVEARAGGARWATATLPSMADYTCPDEKAKVIDARFGMIDAVTFLHADGGVVCTVALRPAGRQAIRHTVRSISQYPTGWYADEARRQEIVDQFAAALDADRIGIFGINLSATEVAVYIESRKFRSMPRSIGRTARALTATMPASVELFEIIPVEGGLPVVSVILQRAAVEDQISLPNAARASWLSAKVRDASPPDWDSVEGTLDKFPRAYWSINPYTPVSFFDPDQPLRFDLSVLANGGVEFMPGLSVNAAVGKRLFGNLDDIGFESDSELPHVRSDIRSYLEEGDPGIQRLSLDYVTKLDGDLYGRVSAGMLEGMFGGVSGELLWQPAERSWGLGAEINWVKQRDFDQRFGFRDYDVVTGHASLYWDTGWKDLSAQIDVGRYLAKDWGGTFTLKRRFSNGWELGAFATFTNVPFSEFGEGSFDKGILLTIPFDWALPMATRARYSTVIRPLTRDGGQRLSIDNRLYPIVEWMGSEELRGAWQGFWK